MIFFHKLQQYLHYWFALVILTALPLGYYFPGISKSETVIPWLLFVMLYPMMINLRIEDVLKAFSNFRLVMICLVVNFFISPVLGAIWAYFLFHNADPYLALGFILKVTVPCSGMVAAWTGYAKGRVESALVLVATSFVLAVFMVPVMMWLLADTYVQVHPFMLFNKMLIIVVAPLAAGLITRRLIVKKVGPKTYKEKIAPVFPGISTCGVLPMIFIIIASQADFILANWLWALLVILGIGTLYPIIALISLFFAKSADMDYGDTMAIIFSSTAKNHAITIGLATAAFGGSLAVFPAAVAPIIQMPIMLVILKLSGRIKQTIDGRSSRPRSTGASDDKKDSSHG
ncbi:MAG: arsenic resistance protein [Desulfotignum sp.]